MLNPRELKSPHELAQGFVDWDMAHKAYVDAGGKLLDDERKCGAIMHMLPDLMRTEILLKYENFADQPKLLRQWVLHHAKLLVKGRTLEA